MAIALGIIGGSGLYQIPGLTNVRSVRVRTPFGEPSDPYLIGRLGGVQLCFLPRHGAGHRLLPSEVNSRANVWGFKKLGVERLLSLSAVGSLRENVQPGDVLVSVDPRYFRPAEVESLLGDASRARTQLGWTPKIGFEELVHEMARADLLSAQCDDLVRRHGFPSYNYHE